MHVGVVTVVHHPLDARIFHRQVGALLAAGHQVTYIAPWRSTGVTPPASMRSLDVPRAQGVRRLPALAAARHTVKAVRHELDVVVLHDPELLVALAGLRLPPTVWDVHEDTAAALSAKAWLPPPLRGAARLGIRLVERCAENSAFLLLAEEGYANRFRRRHPVVPNQTLVPENVPPPGRERVVYLGTLTRARGVEELLALPPLLAAGVHLEVIGAAPEPNAARLLTNAHEDGALVWHGFLPNAEALRLAQGALAGLSLLRDEPNYRHSRPTKVVEYMAMGVPVITTPTPVAAAIVRRHRCGVVVPFEDPHAVADAIADLRSDDARRHALGRSGHEAARRHYDWSPAAQEFVAVLERMASRAPQSQR